MAYSGFTDAISRETNHPPVLAFLVPMGCKTNQVTSVLYFYDFFSKSSFSLEFISKHTRQEQIMEGH